MTVQNRIHRLSTAVIIVAAGTGTRAGGPVPKQYQICAGKPILQHTIERILRSDRVDQLVCVISPAASVHYDPIHAAIDDMRLMSPADGGATRAASVQAGLAAFADAPPENILIHDAARPGVTLDMLNRVIVALETHDGAYPALPVSDALWRDQAPQPRDGLKRAQTPQGFTYQKIVAAYEGADQNALDDVEIAIAAGLSVAQIQGDEHCLKITYETDMAIAEKILRTAPDIRVGNGYDVHAFEDGTHVVLCGVHIDHPKALKGHSDADVAMHAITDAIYGALGEGDIGQWFPPSDPQWKGAASDIFLKHACERVGSNGFELSHIDCTIICEQPKIGPHTTAMREMVSVITGLEVGRISVKATTSERLGFTGREEGIAAQATATLVKP